ncbi:hypothetical protein Leryth_006862 [Lithospermum erythrorhizon]|nr:hypothetical protein Leryth_006862 [Lithospermum erythrorhizon]
MAGQFVSFILNIPSTKLTQSITIMKPTKSFIISNSQQIIHASNICMPVSASKGDTMKLKD